MLINALLTKPESIRSRIIDFIELDKIIAGQLFASTFYNLQAADTLIS